MSNGRQFGHPQKEPNEPWLFRDQRHNCSTPGCSNTYCGLAGRQCTACSVDSMMASVMAMREPMRELAGGEE